jgi:hypothetical protein
VRRSGQYLTAAGTGLRPGTIGESAVDEGISMNRPPNMQQLMKQAQQMQEQLMAAQAELAEMTFEGPPAEAS